MAEPIRQLLFASVARVGEAPGTVNAVLRSARNHNKHDNITGLMYSDGGRYVQAIEGAPDVVEETFRRIRADHRHHHVTVLADRTTDHREFGDLAMAFHDEAEERLDVDHRMRDALMKASPELRARFLDLIDD